MHTFALFGVKNFEFFEIYGVSAWARAEGDQFFAILSGCLLWMVPFSLIFFTLNLLLVRSHQAEIIIVKHLIQGRNNMYDEGGS